MEYRLLRKICSGASLLLSFVTLVLGLREVINLLNQQSRFKELFPRGSFSTRLLLPADWVLIGAIVTGIIISTYTLWTIFFPYGWEMPRATRQQKILVKQVLFAAVVFIEFGALLTAVIVTATTGPEVSVPGKTTEEIDELLDLKGECMHYKDARGQIAYTVIGWLTWIITLLCFALDRLDHDNTTFRPGMHMHSEVDVPAPAMVDFNMAKTPQSMTMKRGLSEVSLV